MVRKKSLLIGINYTGSQNELRGCHQDVENVAEFLYYRGFSSDPRSQVILRDDAPGPYYPTGHNMLVTSAEPCFPRDTSLTRSKGGYGLARERAGDVQLLALLWAWRPGAGSHWEKSLRRDRYHLPRRFPLPGPD